VKKSRGLDGRSERENVYIRHSAQGITAFERRRNGVSNSACDMVVAYGDGF
jgi:hypothetical protein